LPKSFFPPFFRLFCGGVRFDFFATSRQACARTDVAHTDWLLVAVHAQSVGENAQHFLADHGGASAGFALSPHCQRAHMKAVPALKEFH